MAENKNRELNFSQSIEPACCGWLSLYGGGIDIFLLVIFWSNKTTNYANTKIQTASKTDELIEMLVSHEPFDPSTFREFWYDKRKISIKNCNLFHNYETSQIWNIESSDDLRAPVATEVRRAVGTVVIGVLARVHHVWEAETRPEKQANQTSHQMSFSRWLEVDASCYQAAAAWACYYDWIGSEWTVCDNWNWEIVIIHTKLITVNNAINSFYP